MKKSFTPLLVPLIALLPAGYLILIWNSLPPTVPLHFGLDMKPDRFGDKGEVWLPVIILAAVSIGVYFLLRNLHRIDPKQKGTTPSPTFNRLAIGVVVFIAALNFMIITATKGSTVLSSFLFPVLGLLFAFVGNYMNNIKPNYFAGFRVPWTLSSNENWRRTHQLVGKLWFAGGLLLAIVSLFLTPEAAAIFFGCVIAVLVIIPMVYSYNLFKHGI